MVVIYPGSFDPVTYGHLDIIGRCSKKFDHVIVSVMNNPTKKTLFSIDERAKLLREAVKDYENVEVDVFSGLLVDYAKSKGVSTAIRGLRAMTDFEYELQMALMNRELDNDLETIFLMSSSKYTFLSSSVVKEVATFNGDISGLVPNNVQNAMHNKFKGE